MKNNLHKCLFQLIPGLFILTLLFPGNIIADAGSKVGIKIMQKEELGGFLASGNGMTLYSYAKDENNSSNCIEGCALIWPPFYAEPSAVIKGCEASDFATITRTDGKMQTTYKSKPLYSFKNDLYPGDTLGQGIGEVWFIVKPE